MHDIFSTTPASNICNYLSACVIYQSTFLIFSGKPTKEVIQFTQYWKGFFVSNAYTIAWVQCDYTLIEFSYIGIMRSYDNTKIKASIAVQHNSYYCDTVKHIVV